LITAAVGEEQAVIYRHRVKPPRSPACPWPLPKPSKWWRLKFASQAAQLAIAEKALDAYSLLAAGATTTLIAPGNMTEVSVLIPSAIKFVHANQAAAWTDWPPRRPGRGRSHCYNSAFWSGG